ncbi:peptidase M20 [Arthrobacter sp. MYb224]|uniref:M20 family metallopeptidase n=1 Tax=Micrococcaceae TaxID=1268 RepID=UPI000CFBA169|nr:MULTISPECIES: M20 family metallopeptidase [unclassified Arthrobacter]PRA00403.1 peptidase M20 [Arthrobacter sp. MYb224]PRA04595.1 peptidase M20 [Arthrobacter sp. MYb229]PRB51493.1 peptidase M20 [Arthrobacter sp. MYb216]
MIDNPPSPLTAGLATNRERVMDAVRREQPALVAYSERIHANPELGWEEHRAAGWTAEFLAERGFIIEGGYLGFPTALRASFGTGSRRIGLMAEYDALPGLGHACGHNIISAASVGAACALAGFADEYDLCIELYGTPAEEGGGGKIEMLKKGAFQGLDLAMMVHPSPVDSAVANPFAVAHQQVEYRGKSAHAAAYPDQGINANDAFVIAQVALGLLRQQLPQETRVHGVQTRGGEAPNAIPETTRGRWYVRAETLAELEPLHERVNKCFEAGALATGAQLEITPESEPYSEFRTEQRALDIYTAHAQALGRTFDAPPEQATMNRASTDMGNVSQIVPAIHPYIGLGCFPAANHQPEFAAHCIGGAANLAIHDGAIALALTALDFVGIPRNAGNE